MTLPPGPRGSSSISVIIPVWRDLAALEALLLVLRAHPAVREVIVAMAEATPSTSAAVEEMGARCVSAGAPNRGRQMDAGAAVATGEWLLFQHADTDLTSAHLHALAAADAGAAVGGAFYRRFDERHPWLYFLEPVERWHNRTFGALYGDQSIFARREVFAHLGGFRGLALMEDVDFSRRLRRAGRVILLDPPIASSPRKHLAQGSWRTTFRNALLLALYSLGVSPERLHAWYYGGAASSAEAALRADLRKVASPEPQIAATSARPPAPADAKL